MENTFFVSVSPTEAANIISRHIISGSISGELIDDYSIRNNGAVLCRILVFEKYYYRVSNRLTLTVIIDNADGRTRVHSVSGGGGQGVFFRFDWGSSGSFANVPWRAMQNYIL